MKREDIKLFWSIASIFSTVLIVLGIAALGIWGKYKFCGRHFSEIPRLECMVSDRYRKIGG